MSSHAAAQSFAPHRPRLGFAGVGWIGGHRLRSVVADGAADIAWIADPSSNLVRRARREVASSARPPSTASRFEDLLHQDIDGVVIATPSGMHAPQALAALERGLAVFCQKPLACTAAETSDVVATARARNRLLAVDFCYRTVNGVAELARRVRSGELGDVYAVDLTFHNAYGPDKPWFYDLHQSGGGCVMDLGIHLVDLLLWVLDSPPVRSVTSRLYADGKLLAEPARALEDYAMAEVQFETGTTARLTCSWRAAAGCDAVIEAVFRGTRGAVVLRNVGGSFFDFTVEHHEGTQHRVLAAPPDDWGGRAICEWVHRLAVDSAFDSQAGQLVEVAALIDAVYGR